MEYQIYQDKQAFVTACNANSVAPTTVTYEGQEVQGALVRDDNGQVSIMLVCDKACWEQAEFKNRY